MKYLTLDLRVKNRTNPDWQHYSFCKESIPGYKGTYQITKFFADMDLHIVHMTPAAPFISFVKNDIDERDFRIDIMQISLFESDDDRQIIYFDSGIRKNGIHSGFHMSKTIRDWVLDLEDKTL